MSEHLRQIPKRTRFREDIYSAQLACPKGCLRLGMSREDHHGEIRESAPDARQYREAVQSGHDEIKENAIDRRGFDDIERLNAIEGHQNVVSFDAQNLCEYLGNRRVVFDDKYAHGGVPAGSIRAEAAARQGLTFGTSYGI